MSAYVAEVQRKDDTVSRRGSVAEVATWLAAWAGQTGRSVAVYRIDAAGDWHMVDLRATRAQGTAPAGYVGDYRRDAAWDAAVTAAGRQDACASTGRCHGWSAVYCAGCGTVAPCARVDCSSCGQHPEILREATERRARNAAWSAALPKIDSAWSECT